VRESWNGLQEEQKKVVAQLDNSPFPDDLIPTYIQPPTHSHLITSCCCGIGGLGLEGEGN